MGATLAATMERATGSKMDSNSGGSGVSCGCLDLGTGSNSGRAKGGTGSRVERSWDRTQQQSLGKSQSWVSIGAMVQKTQMLAHCTHHFHLQHLSVTNRTAWSKSQAIGCSCRVANAIIVNKRHQWWSFSSKQDTVCQARSLLFVRALGN